MICQDWGIAFVPVHTKAWSQSICAGFFNVLYFSNSLLKHSLIRIQKPNISMMLMSGLVPASSLFLYHFYANNPWRTCTMYSSIVIFENIVFRLSVRDYWFHASTKWGLQLSLLFFHHNLRFVWKHCCQHMCSSSFLLSPVVQYAFLNSQQ